MRSKLLRIDQGYVEIHSVVPKMKSAELTPQDRIAGAFAALDYATRRTIEDTNNKIEDVGHFGPERNLIDSDNNQYDPNAVTHGLTVAAGDVIMLEAYRNKWFDDTKRVVLPDFEKANADAANWAVANLYNANMWRLWKNIDERVRFLNGNLVELPELRADWISHLKSLNPDVAIQKAFEFTPSFEDENFEIFANERLDKFLEQNLHSMLMTTNVAKKIALVNEYVPLPPKGLVSIEEAHAGASLGHLTKTDLSKTRAGKLLLTERLRGYAVLKLLVEQLEKEQKTYCARVPKSRLLDEFKRCGLTIESATTFIELASFRSGSRDLYDQPLVKTTGDDYILFGVSLLMADLVKIMFSSLANEGSVIKDKGKRFEVATVDFLRQKGFNARQLKVKRGEKKEHEFDYDVAFTWGDHVFFLECKNRGIPHGNPIATYHFNQELRNHVTQVRRLRQGLIDYPDILEKDFPEAIGKNPVFCVLNALPFSIGQLEDTYIIDDAILRKFFSSPSLGFTSGRIDGEGPHHRTDLRKLWSGQTPTVSEFIQYIKAPPQLVLASKSYEMMNKVETLSLDAFVKVIGCYRKDLDAAAIAKILRDI
ncbi:hypothetical protein CSQ91_02255 [Janthinobacterium sp. BJB301]|nr:hypothetical protein CSQ91_02255 [Janthinobacterium sp. BJB301]